MLNALTNMLHALNFIFYILNFTTTISSDNVIKFYFHFKQCS